MNLSQPSPMELSGNLADTWRRFRQRFEIYIKASGMAAASNSVKVSVLLHVIGEGAVEVYNTFEYEDEGEAEDLDIVLEKFETYYTPQKNITFERNKFLTYCQTTETLDQFVTELKRRAKSCEFGNLTNEMIKDRVVAGIKNQSVKERLLRIPDLDLDRAINICHAAEATESQIKDMQPEKPIESISTKQSCKPKHKYNKNIRHKEMQRQGNGNHEFRNPCGRCGTFHNKGNCPAYGKNCLKCNGLNHFARVCKARIGIQDQRRRFNQVNSLENEINENEDKVFMGTITAQNIDVLKNDKWHVKFSINGHNLVVKIDTGAQVNALSYTIFKMLDLQSSLLPTTTRITAYGGTEIPVKGETYLKCNFEEKTYNLKFIIVDAETEAILGCDDCERLGLISRVHDIKMSTKFMSKYADVFKGLGCLKHEYKISIDKNVTPVINPPRKVPFKLRDKFRKELDNMEKQGIIAKVTHPTEWVNNIVIVEKYDGSLRICLDPRDLNKAVLRERYHIPTLEEITAKIGNAKFCTVLDARSGFWQIPLHEESTDLCTFNTEFGRYKFLRMPFGISSASEVYQRTMDETLEGLNASSPYLDDILVWGVTEEEHDKNVEETLQRIREANLKLKKEKCKFKETSIKYVGHIISKDGIKIDPSKVKAITEIKIPTDKKDLERFLGMVNYLCKFIPNLSHETAVLRDLLKQDVAFQWQPAHQQCFERLKHILVTAPVLQFYDPSKDHKISCDASNYGIGGVLLQNDKPVAYTSRTLTSCERNYAQIEKEALAITYTAEKFHQFIYGHRVKVETDHKPLETIFKRNLNDIPPRLQRFRLRVQKYDLDVSYKPGRQMYIADTLSRSPLNIQDSEDEMERDSMMHIHSLVQNLPISETLKLELIKNTASDEETRMLMHYAKTEWPIHSTNVPNCVKPYLNMRDEIHCIDGLLFKGTKLIVPKALRLQILERIHEGHMGISKCIARAREHLYWSKMSSDITNFVLSCTTCITHQRSNSNEPLLQMPLPSRPWERLGMDIFDFKGKHYLLIVDYFSKYPEVMILNSLLASDTINVCKSIFARHGIPSEVITDNGPQFKCKEFASFAKEWEFHHITTSPLYPQANGFAERTVQTIKNLLLKAKDPYLSLLEYRNTPVVDLGHSPTQLLMGRRLRTKLPTTDYQLKPKTVNMKIVQDKMVQCKKRQKTHFDNRATKLPNLEEGDEVYMQRQKTWIPGTIRSKCTQPRSFIVSTQVGDFRRNRKFIHKPPERKLINLEQQEKLINDYHPVQDSEDQHANGDHSTQTNFNTDPQTPRFKSSRRQIVKPKRLIEEL